MLKVILPKVTLEGVILLNVVAPFEQVSIQRIFLTKAAKNHFLHIRHFFGQTCPSVNIVKSFRGFLLELSMFF
jgi:hypothetical protein